MPTDAVPPSQVVERRLSTEPRGEVIGGLIVSFILGSVSAVFCALLIGFGTEGVAVGGLCGLALALLGPGVIIVSSKRRGSDRYDQLSVVNWMTFASAPALLAFYLARHVL